MRRKWLSWLLCVFLIVGLTACSNNGSKNSANNSSSSTSKSVSRQSSTDMAINQGEKSSADSGKTNKGNSEAPNPENKQMIIYNADLTVIVKEFNHAQRNVQNLIDKAGGYTVQSEVTKVESDGQGGTVVARIPQPKFDSFISEVSKAVDKVESQRITGEDVTKQYVDLESRLKAKKTLEARLNTFLQQAKDTDDLLKISDGLANVQEEIESIKGQMNYLKNHSDLSTVTIHFVEKSVKIKDKKDLNTWEKTKNAFITSINAIVTFFSGVFIFLAGYSPILIPLLVIGWLIYFFVRKRSKKN